MAAYTELKNLIVWNKDNGGMGAFYRSKHELIFAFKNGQAAHINNFELGQHGRWELSRPLPDVRVYDAPTALFGSCCPSQLGLEPYRERRSAALA